jgi:very-short-patch-repair endonuclease
LQRTNRKNQTRAEQVLWDALRNGQLEGTRFLRQKAFGRYIVDFYCASARLVIELDGEVHDTPEAFEYDAIRAHELEARGLLVVRFRNECVYNDLHSVLSTIREKIHSSCTP